MHLVLAYSHVDVKLALKSMKWIGWLSEKNGNSMLSESILLLASRKASRYEFHKEICWLAARIFGQARCYVPETEHEKGWPASANWMFKQALFHVEQHFRSDLFFLEPDGIPLVPHWWDVIQSEWLIAQSMGKEFMGAYVPHNTPHMTGIAVYGRDWRKRAPSLAECPDYDAFDTHSGSEVIPNAHFVPLIQHVFRRHERGWTVPNLGILDKRAVIFHQDKQGKLIPMIDTMIHGGFCDQHKLFSYGELFRPQLSMTKFYYTANATRAHNVNGMRFTFEPMEAFGGAIPGVMETDDADRQAALVELTSNPGSGVTELSQEDYEKITKKKWQHPLLSTSGRSNVLPQPTSPLNLPVFPVPGSNSPALLVAEPLTSHSTETQLKTGTISNIADVLKTEELVPSQPNPFANIKSSRPRKETK